MSADERRESVIRAAMHEFARGGYHGTSTETIAKRVGVSQPYLFRLFPSKQAIFVEAVARCTEDIRLAFEEASEGLDGEDALKAMAVTYTRLIAEHPDKLLMQLQSNVAVAAAEAAGETEFGVMVRDGWMRLWDTVRAAIGGDADQTAAFMAHGMLINTLTALGFPPEHRVWEGCGLLHEADGPEPDGRTSA